ncbi:hypothetical protein AADG42_16430 [Ammonicoccus fulvus]|uniref:Lipoprotein n=1 Tax=Ammonicoccus fulvus TaxID=3138240 RepID=A0ABZ3FW76_9ACTN
MKMRWLVGCLAAALMVTSCSAGAGPEGSASTDASPSAAHSATPSAAELFNGALADVGAATSVRITVSGMRGGNQVAMEVAGVRDGSNQVLLIAQGEGKGVAEVITVDGKEYVKGDLAFWTATQGLPRAKARQFVGKYALVKGTAYSRQWNPDVFLKLLSNIGEVGESHSFPVTEIIENGAPMYQVTMDAGNAQWYDREAPRHLRRTVVTKGSDRSDMTYSDWNSVPRVTAPSADQIVA